MSNFSNKHIRAFSAKSHFRTVSDKNRSTRIKTDQSILYGSNNNTTSKPILNYITLKSNAKQSNNNLLNKLLPQPQHILKDKQQLFEENLQLKTQVNTLKDQLNRNKAKMQNIASKNQTYTKKLNRQFEKKMYWTGSNSHMISGIKNQYQRIKEELQSKNNQCEALRRQLVETGVQQIRIYAQALQQENKKLIQRIKTMSEISEKIVFQEGLQNISQYKYHELRRNQTYLREQVSKKRQIIQKQRSIKVQLKRKVEFLEGIVIQKQNQHFKAIKKTKKLERQKNQYISLMRNLEIRINQLTHKSQEKLYKLKQIQNKKFQQQKIMYNQALKDKDQVIQNLKKQVAYLSTLLKYWKPLDQLNDIVGHQENSHHESDSQISIHRSNNVQQFLRKSNNLQQANQNLGEQIQNKQFGQIRSSQIGQDIKDKQESVERVQKVSSKRHNEKSIKKKKVQLREIQDIGQHLKFRLMGLNLTIQQIKSYFSFKQQTHLSETNKSWEKQYITMKQVMSILQKQPFSLSQEQAYLLSRYLIQDNQSSVIYCDLQNQNNRTIVKSIMKTILGDYQILNQQQKAQVEKQCEFIIDKYSANLISALSTMYSDGLIPAKKFIELIENLGIQISNKGKDMLICKMLLQSDSLSKLDYMTLF